MTYLTVDNFPVGQKILSKDHQQPGIVVDKGEGDRSTFSHAWFDVEWVRHPGKVRRYYTGIGPTHEFEWNHSTWPTPVDSFDGIVIPRVAFVDSLKEQRSSLETALVNSLVESPNTSVGIDLNKFLTELAAAGWVYSPDN